MVEPSCLEWFLVQEARDLDVRLRAFPQQLFLRLRAQFGGAVGDEMLDGVDRFLATPLEDVRRYWPPIRTWFIDAHDAFLSWLSDLQNLRAVSRGLVALALPNVYAHLSAPRDYRLRLAQRAYWMFLCGTMWDEQVGVTMMLRDGQVHFRLLF